MGTLARLGGTAGSRQVWVPMDGFALPGIWTWPAHPSGVVVFAHGSGSSRLSPRNRYVARQLRSAGLATLLFDLLTEREAADRHNVFDVSLLGTRVVAGVRWIAGQPEAENLPVGVLGASAGAGAALIAAARSPASIAAVVSRGGRPDLAGEALACVGAPTLLLVGGHDEAGLALNRQAWNHLACIKRLVVIPGAGHLFEEPGTLASAAQWAAEWFVHYLAMARTWAGRSSSPTLAKPAVARAPAAPRRRPVPR